jgi:transposase
MDKRRTVNGILWVLRTGAPWRDMPRRYGNWNSGFVRFTRWSKLGVWDAAFEMLASLGPPADEEHAIDSTIVRAHQHAAGVKGGIRRSKLSAARAAASRPKSTSARTPKAIRWPSISLGARSMKRKASTRWWSFTMRNLPSDEIRNDLAKRGIKPVIPPRSNRTTPIEYDRQAYKRRNLIERCVNRLKQFRRIATRYEKTARAFASMLCIAAARLWIKTVNTT